MEDCRQQDAESRPLLRKGLGLEESKAFANVAVRPAHSVGNIWKKILIYFVFDFLIDFIGFWIDLFDFYGRLDRFLLMFTW